MRRRSAQQIVRAHAVEGGEKRHKRGGNVHAPVLIPGIGRRGDAQKIRQRILSQAPALPQNPHLPAERLPAGPGRGTQQIVRADAVQLRQLYQDIQRDGVGPRLIGGVGPPVDVQEIRQFLLGPVLVLPQFTDAVYMQGNHP